MSERFTQLGDLIQEEMTRWRVPGTAVGVWFEGQAATAGFGVTSVAHPLPLDERTLFQIGSTTKTVTATAVMRLAERGKLDLHAPLRTYLPQLRLADSAVAERVTLHHLFTHTSGWAGDFFLDTGMGDDALARYVAAMVRLPQLTPPGALWHYNNAGFSLAGRVIEVVTGQPYETAVGKLVLAPLGMEMSFFFAHEAITHRVAVGHFVDEEESEPQVARPWALARSANAAGGIVSNVVDQLRYARFHLGDGAAEDGTRLLSRKSLQQMQTPQVKGHLDNLFGLSWFLRDVDGVRVVRHGGATNGQLSAFLFVPERDFALTVLTNGSRGNKLHETVTNWALERYLGLKTEEPRTFARPTAELEEYVGVYEAQAARLEVSLQEGTLLLTVTDKGGFPDENSPPAPSPPPTRVAFCAADRIVALDPPLAGDQAEFVRDEDGRILWLRTSRLHRRQR